MTTEKQIKTVQQNTESEIVERDRFEKIRKSFSDADNYIPETGLLKEYNDLISNSKVLTPSQKKRKKELTQELSILYGLENGLWVANLSYIKYYKSLTHMRRNIIEQYKCHGVLEFMLADRIVASYWRAMKYDTIFSRLIEKENESFSFDQLKVNILKEWNKGLELANRQLSMNIILLKELKQPKLDVRVRANSAFISQNQQLNVNTSNKNENIKST
jgi:hypothetical protein